MSTPSYATALSGIDGATASAGSCASASPPKRLMIVRPATPSFRLPVRMTPITRAPKFLAPERNIMLMEGRE